jgi:peptidoglycan/LPS O-acetylase OafA/YrhL
VKIKSFSSIDGLRAWMAWWVVFGHAIQVAGAPSWLPKSIENTLLRGDVAVNIFIIVSGFVITHLMIGKNEGYRPYLVRRFFRLAPVYFFCLMISLLTVSAYTYAYIELPYAFQREAKAIRIDETYKHLAAHLIAHATLLHGAIPTSILPFSATTILAPAWSLSLEWQFYISAPLLIYLLSRSWLSFGTTTSALLVLSVLCQKRYGNIFEHTSMLLLPIQFFLIGISTRLALHHAEHRGRYGSILFLAALCLITYRWRLEGLIWSLWCAFMCWEWALIPPDSKIGHITAHMAKLMATNKMLTKLGSWSYSTYLVHTPLFSVFIYLGGVPLAMGHTQTMVQWYVLISIITLPLISWFLYQQIERRGIKLGANIANNL